MADEEPFSDDIDLAELESIEQSRRQRPPSQAMPVKADPGPDLASLKAQLLRVQGENAILRSSLEQSERQHEDRIRDMVLTQSKRKDDMSELNDEIANLKKELERLKTERQFLANEVQDVSLQARRERARAMAATQQQGPGADGSARNASQTTPTKSPSRKRLRKDIEASFRDGFDSFLLSPTHRKRKQDMVARMSAAAASPGDIDMADAVSPESLMKSPQARLQAMNASPWSVAAEEELRRQRRVVDFHRIIEEHVMPNYSQRSLEVLDTHPQQDERDANSAPVSDGLRRALTDHEGPVTAFVKRCALALEIYVQRGMFAPTVAALSLLRTAVEFEPEAVLKTDETSKETLELVLGIIRSVIDNTAGAVQNLPKKFDEFTVGTSRATMLQICALDLLETITSCCAVDRALQRECWRLIPFDLIRSLLQPTLPSNILTKAVVILTASVSDAHIGHVNAYLSKSVLTSMGALADRQAAEETQILDALGRLLVESPPSSPAVLFSSLSDYKELPFPIRMESLIPGGAVWYLDWGTTDRDMLQSAADLIDDQLTVALRTLIVRLFVFVIIRRGVALVANNQQLLASIVDMLSSEMVAIYQESFDSHQRIALVSNGVRLLHAIWRLHANSTAVLNLLPSSVSHELVVFLARVALSDGPMGTTLFDTSIIDSARDMLEDSMTLSEADDVFLSMRPV